MSICENKDENIIVHLQTVEEAMQERQSSIGLILRDHHYKTDILSETTRLSERLRGPLVNIWFWSCMLLLLLF